MSLRNIHTTYEKSAYRSTSSLSSTWQTDHDQGTRIVTDGSIVILKMQVMNTCNRFEAVSPQPAFTYNKQAKIKYMNNPQSLTICPGWSCDSRVKKPYPTKVTEQPKRSGLFFLNKSITLAKSIRCDPESVAEEVTKLGGAAVNATSLIELIGKTRRLTLINAL